MDSYGSGSVDQHSFFPLVGRVSLVNVARDIAWVALGLWYANVAVLLIVAKQ